MNVAEAVWRSLNNQMTIFVYFLTKKTERGFFTPAATCTSFNAFHKLFVPLTAVTNDLLMSIASCSNGNEFARFETISSIVWSPQWK